MNTFMDTYPLAMGAMVVAGGVVVLGLRLVRRRLTSRINTRESYEIVGHLADGDLSSVEVAIRNREKVVLKLPRVKSENDLVKKEFRLLQTLHKEGSGTKYGAYLPKPVDSFVMDGFRINAFRWQEGLYPAVAVRNRYEQGLDGRHLAWMFNRVLEVLGFVHKNGWVHGAVLPPHLLYHAESHGLQLVGWIHAVRLTTPLRVVPKDYKLWYPPECQENPIVTPSVDLYLAARSMIYLAGGNPLSDKMPKHVPSDIARFIRSCLLESPRMRPQDAWKLHEEFRDVLDSVYGPPRFTALAMS